MVHISHTHTHDICSLANSFRLIIYYMFVVVGGVDVVFDYSIAFEIYLRRLT